MQNKEQMKENVKFVVGSLAVFGVSAIVGAVVKKITPVNATWLQKLALAIGSVALISMVSDAAEKHANGKVEEFFDNISFVEDEIPEESEV